MDDKIKNIIQALELNTSIDYSKDCIYILNNNEIMLDDEIILEKKDAEPFYIERFKMQSFLFDEKLKIIKKEFIDYFEKLNQQDKIIIIELTDKEHNYQIIKSDEKDIIFYILKGFNNLKKKKEYIDTINKYYNIHSIGISYYIKGDLIKYYK
ncbi:hypothetical protein FBBAL38_03380 [Flavobacteria bacterium BAL38]|nr:hypothetical protein FBBAL38_03380 [Flavobacteria bacterium BAL38]